MTEQSATDAARAYHAAEMNEALDDLHAKQRQYGLLKGSLVFFGFDPDEIDALGGVEQLLPEGVLTQQALARIAEKIRAHRQEES